MSGDQKAHLAPWTYFFTQGFWLQEAMLILRYVQVMLSSISASAKGVANHSIYSGSKGAVEAFARCLAVGEFSPHCPFLT